MWDAALDSDWERPAVWVHGDVAPSNVLVADGRLAAVLDFGCCAVGDPACDLTMAWTAFGDRSRLAFRSRLALDDGTWRRARGWALWKALVTAAQGARAAEAARIRFGWRLPVSQLLELVLSYGPMSL
ncbi:MAG TPA: phosphotransferase [Streptosporangiaceae bacterium]